MVGISSPGARPAGLRLLEVFPESTDIITGELTPTKSQLIDRYGIVVGIFSKPKTMSVKVFGK
jgi:hypothetical protein